MLKLTIVAGLMGLVIGWVGGNWAIMQPWWPVSISGRPEVVISGKLVLSPTDSEVGLAVDDPASNHKFVDASQVNGTQVHRLIGRQVKVRGVTSSTGSVDYVLITKINQAEIWAR